MAIVKPEIVDTGESSIADHFQVKFSGNVVSKAPHTALYFPNFLTQAEAELLWKQVYAAPKPKWTQLSGRRLQNWGGLPREKGMVIEKLPEWLQSAVDRLCSVGLFADKLPNHVLVNEYTPGQGIMPHTDGPLYYPVVCTLNLGSHTLLNFMRRQSSESLGETTTSDGSGDGDAFSLLLEPLSLSVVAADLYTDYMHGISERAEDSLHDIAIQNLDMCSGVTRDLDTSCILQRGTRVSLTIRHVLKTVRLPLRFGKSC